MDSGRRFAAVWTSPRWIASAVLLWTACAAVYFLTAPGRIDMFDGGVRHDVTESLIEIGRPAVRDPWFPGLPGRGDYLYSWYELGSSVAAIPFVLAARRLSGGSLEAKQFAFSMTSVPFAAGAVALVFLIYGRLGCSFRRSLGWALAVAFGTLLWPYAGSAFDAALQAFWLTLAVWGAVEALAAVAATERDGFSRASTSRASTGLASYAWAVVSGVSFAVLVNVQEAYLVLVACVLATVPMTRKALLARAFDRRVLTILAGAGVGVAMIALANVWRYGNPLVTGRDFSGGAHPVFGNPVIGAAGLLMSPAKSIFLYSPTCALAVVGLWRLSKEDRNRFAPIVACVLIHLSLIATLRFWAGEWAWGPRYLVATLPLVCLGLPFARLPRGVTWIRPLLISVSIAVQLLAISVDHQRFYFDRSLPPFFWIDEAIMYRGSPLFSRPAELLSVIDGRDLEHARALVPGPRPLSMTSSIFGPPPSQLATGHLWTRQYLVFVVPRPWTLWSRYLPVDQRPGQTEQMTMIGVIAAVAAFTGLFAMMVPASGRTEEMEKTEETV